MPELAVFDLDGTVLEGDSFRAFLFWLYLKKQIKLSNWRKGITVSCKRKLGLLSHHEFKAGMLQPLKGMTRDDIDSRGREFVKVVGQGMIRRDAVDKIAACREEGHQVVLATASPDVYVESFANSLNIPTYLSVHLIYSKNGRFTGELEGGTMLGDDKVRQILARSDDRPITLAFSDSESDLALLRAAKTPVIVNPNRTLRTIARRNGWQTESWQ